MNLHEQTILIEELIKEDSNATVGDLVSILEEMRRIEVMNMYYEAKGFASDKIFDPKEFKGIV